jgi:ribosomal protein S18 acetylase RimI-like enzyme
MLCQGRWRSAVEGTKPMEIIIRSAQYKDASFLAWLMLAAGRAHVRRGIWEVILNEPEEKCLGFFEHLVTTADRHLFHHSCFLLAETSGNPAAGLGGYDPATLGYHTLSKALPDAFRRSRLRPNSKLGGTVPPRIVECVPPALEGAWVIENVATLPEFRRKGMVDRLLGEMIEMGRAKGFCRAQINIYIGNEPARMAYEKHGFRVLDEKRDAYFESEIGCPGMARLVREI